jgi:hypothetical protein
LKFEDCRAAEASLAHGSFGAGPTTSFLQFTGVPPLIRGLRITGGLRVNTALINGGTGTSLVLSGAYIECNGQPISEPGSVDNSCIYVNPGQVIPQPGAISEAEQFPRKIVPHASYSFNMESKYFGAGTSSAPTCWTLSGAGATIGQNTTAGQIKAAAQGVALTRAGADARLAQTVGSIPRWSELSGWGGKTVTFGRWVYASVAGCARLSIVDGIARTYSAYHSGGSAPEFLTVTVRLASNLSQVTIENNVDTVNATAVFSGGAFIVGSGMAPLTAQPQEWQGASVDIVLNSISSIATNSTTSMLIGVSPPQTPIAFAGVMSKMYMAAQGAPGAAQTYTYTLRKNTGTTILTSTTSGAAATTSSDLTHQVALAAGDTFDMLVVTSATAAAGVHVGGIKYEEVPF